jgi:hypothetical protein
VRVVVKPLTHRQIIGRRGCTLSRAHLCWAPAHATFNAVLEASSYTCVIGRRARDTSTSTTWQAPELRRQLNCSTSVGLPGPVVRLRQPYRRLLFAAGVCSTVAEDCTTTTNTVVPNQQIRVLYVKGSSLEWSSTSRYSSLCASFSTAHFKHSVPSNSEPSTCPHPSRRHSSVILRSDN